MEMETETETETETDSVVERERIEAEWTIPLVEKRRATELPWIIGWKEKCYYLRAISIVSLGLPRGGLPTKVWHPS